MPNPDEWGPGSKATSHAHLHDERSDVSASTSGAGQPTAEAGGGGTAASSGSEESSAAYNASMLDKRAANQNKRARKRQAAAEEGEQGPLRKGSKGTVGEEAPATSTDVDAERDE